MNIRIASGSIAQLVGLVLSGWLASAVEAADQPQWGQWQTRNMVSAEKGLPAEFDLKTGRNVLWSAELGSECYSTPVVAGGRLLIGTNNENPRDENHKGDRGVLMCFDAGTGKFLWQLLAPKLQGDVYLDWPRAGICSPPTVEGNRVYAVTNRDEAVCLDLLGLANGNDEPFLDEAEHMTPNGEKRQPLGPAGADILWLFDLRSGAGVRPHDSAHCSTLIDGPLLYLNTSNGLNSTHSGVEKPDAPSLIVLDKRSGRLVARDDEHIGPRVFHSTWSSPALAEVAGRKLVIFCGGDGVVYAFEALKPPAVDAAKPTAGAPPAKLSRVWRFDCDPTAPKEDVHRYIRNRRESPTSISSMPVFHKDRVYVTCGGDIWWGKHEAWLKCIDATQTGDITARGQKWSYRLDKHCCSTPSVNDGLVYVADCGGKVHCVDAETGEAYWVHDAGGEIWASTLVADGKVYVGTRRGQFWVLATGKQKRVLHQCRFDDGIVSSAVAADGVLFVGTHSRIYALKQTEKK